jgi:hypothetical protein
MVIKIQCGQVTLFADKLLVEENCSLKEQINGVGYIVVSLTGESIWTGECHLYPEEHSKMRVFIGDITSVETRSNMDETLEYWHYHFSRTTRRFSQDTARELTRILQTLENI